MGAVEGVHACTSGYSYLASSCSSFSCFLFTPALPLTPLLFLLLPFNLLLLLLLLLLTLNPEYPLLKVIPLPSFLPVTPFPSPFALPPFNPPLPPSLPLLSSA